MLDRSIKRALEHADGTRPVIAHSGVLPHPPQLDGTDTHVYFGWYHGEERDFPRFLRTMPRLARFVSEFGAQSVPNDADFCEPERWPDLDWERLGHTHTLQKPLFDRYVPPAEHATFDEWRDATQRYQAEVVRHHIEALRRTQVPPHRRLRPVLLRRRPPGRHLVGARPRPLAEARLRRAPGRLPARDRRGRPPARGRRTGRTDRARRPRGERPPRADRRRRGDGDAALDRRRSRRGGGVATIAADACVRVGTVRHDGALAAGPIELLLTCRYDGAEVTNRYLARCP